MKNNEKIPIQSNNKPQNKRRRDSTLWDIIKVYTEPESRREEIQSRTQNGP